jgi:hypothetical protein
LKQALFDHQDIIGDCEKRRMTIYVLMVAEPIGAVDGEDVVKKETSQNNS